MEIGVKAVIADRKRDKSLSEESYEYESYYEENQQPSTKKDDTNDISYHNGES